METYFRQKNWEDFTYQRLNELIAKYKNDPNAYVIFDFDNTSTIMDIEDNLMIYLMENLLYKLTPEEFYAILTADFFDQELSNTWDSKRPALTGYHLAKDIKEQYEYLYDNYISKEDQSIERLKQVQQTPEFVTFRAKLRYFYLHANTHFKREPNHPWLTYLFANRTLQEFQQLASEGIQAALKKPFTLETYTSDARLPGLTGQVTASFQSGLSFPTELLDLFKAFHRAKIDTYIVSASPHELVKVAVENHGYQIPANRIIGMEFQLDVENKIMARMDPDAPITRGDGKTKAIQTLIMPQHGQREPIAIFGDSIGDYHMIKTFKHSDLNVIFNRHMNDDFRQFVDQAVQQYQQPQARFVLQGRDDNAGTLRPSVETIPYGKIVSGLYQEDIQE